MAVNDDATLGCGRSIDAVWANIDHLPTPHESTCEQCRAARISLSALHQFTARQRTAERTAEQTDGSYRPSARARERVLAIARSEVRRGRRIPVATTEHGPVLISEQTLLALIRAAADSVSGVRTRRISTTGLVEGGATAAERTGGARVTCRIAVARPVPIPQLTATVRRRIQAALTRHIDLDPDTVDLIVEDLYEL